MNTKQIEKIWNEFKKELTDFRKITNDLHRQETKIIAEMEHQYPKFNFHLEQIKTILWNLNQIPAPSNLITYYKKQLNELLDEYNNIWSYIKEPQKMLKPNFSHNFGSKPSDDGSSDNPERKCFPKGKPH